MDGTTAIAPFLEVKKVNDVLAFSFGKLYFERIPTKVLYPSAPDNAITSAKDFLEGAHLPIPAGRVGALYNWFGDTHRPEQ